MSERSETKPSLARMTRDDWLRLALETLVTKGVGEVRVLTLAQRLGVSRSSFYWFFKSRRDLLDQLLSHWEAQNTAAIVSRAERPAPTITQGVLNVFECWIDERLFDPGLDFAVREWARRSEEVRRVVDEADNQRLAALAEMFGRHGFSPLDAFVRARILYYMQIGHFALDVREPKEQRLGYVEAYLRGFTGQEPTQEELSRFFEIARSGPAEHAAS